MALKKTSTCGPHPQPFSHIKLRGLLAGQAQNSTGCTLTRGIADAVVCVQALCLVLALSST
eukprot:1372718-Rhodomonas_salina.2